MTDNQFKDLKQHLRFAMTIIEKFESGEKDVKDESNWDFLIFNVGISLIEIFRKTGQDPTGTLEWIRVVSKEGDTKGRGYNMTKPRLNPCPRCGGKVEIIDLMSAFGIIMIYCFHCNKRFNLIASDEKTLAELWNKQTPKKEEKHGI